VQNIPEKQRNPPLNSVESFIRFESYEARPSSQWEDLLLIRNLKYTLCGYHRSLARFWSAAKLIEKATFGFIPRFLVPPKTPKLKLLFPSIP